MSGELQLIDLIGKIYEAALDADRFKDLGGLLAPHFGTESAMIHTSRQSSLEMPVILSATANFDHWAWSAYVEHYHDRNVWFQRGTRRGPGTVVLGQELVPDSELLRSEWYDYCHKLRAFHLLGINASIAEGVVGGIGFQRPRSRGAFGEDDRRKAQFILPHLQRALQMRHRLARLTDEHTMALGLVDSLKIAVLFVRADSRLLFANRIAERVLRSGQFLSVSRGRLRTRDPSHQPDLDRLIGEAALMSNGTEVRSGGILPLSRDADTPLALLISPLRCEALGYGSPLPAAVVLFSDPNDRSPILERSLMQAYRLTKAEARLLGALLRGQSPSEYADAAGLSINTVKTQMRHVFGKTGYNRHADLIRAVVGNPVFRIDDGQRED